MLSTCSFERFLRRRLECFLPRNTDQQPTSLSNQHSHIWQHQFPAELTFSIQPERIKAIDEIFWPVWNGPSMTENQVDWSCSLLFQSTTAWRPFLPLHFRLWPYSKLDSLPYRSVHPSLNVETLRCLPISAPRWKFHQPSTSEVYQYV